MEANRLLYFLTLISTVTAYCNLPPSLWCSSHETAKRCNVEEQCAAARGAKLVELALYYESLCPDCQIFVKNQLWPVYQSIGSILHLTLVPYGNAREEQHGDHWVFTCQHGADECVGNMLATCAIYLAPNTSVHFPYIHCMEASKLKALDSAKKCSGLFPAIPFDKLMSCASGSVGNQLEHQMALMTEQLQPPHKYVPWITLNGVHTDDIQQKAETDLLSLICNTYEGSPKPQACQTAYLGRCWREM